MQRRTLLQATGAAVATLAAPRLVAQEWPNAPVRIVVGFPPGGGTDALARVVAAKLTQMWNQQVIVETKAGVAGVLAAEYEAQQPSDGSTLLMAREHARETFGREHLERLGQAVQQVGVRRRRPVAGLVHVDHLVPRP